MRWAVVLRVVPDSIARTGVKVSPATYPAHTNSHSAATTAASSSSPVASDSCRKKYAPPMPGTTWTRPDDDAAESAGIPVAFAAGVLFREARCGPPGEVGVGESAVLPGKVGGGLAEPSGEGAGSAVLPGVGAYRSAESPGKVGADGSAELPGEVGGGLAELPGDVGVGLGEMLGEVGGEGAAESFVEVDDFALSPCSGVVVPGAGWLLPRDGRVPLLGDFVWGDVSRCGAGGCGMTVAPRARSSWIWVSVRSMSSGGGRVRFAWSAGWRAIQPSLAVIEPWPDQMTSPVASSSSSMAGE